MADGSVTTSGGGGGVTIKDEGSALSTAATTLDFVGSGVTVTGSGAEKLLQFLVVLDKMSSRQ